MLHGDVTQALFSGLWCALAGTTGAVLALITPLQAEPLPPDHSVLPAAAPTDASAPQSLLAQETMQTVPAGSYLLGSDVGPPSQRPAHRVAVERFLIDETEVTNAAFAEYLNALELKVQEPFEAGELTTRQVGSETVPLLLEGRQGSGLYPLIALDDDEARIGYAEGRFRPTPGYEDHPVAETTWAGARAYCLWRGARLPSEAEWEAAARGLGTRSYPWGEALPDDARVFVSGRSGVTGAVGLRPAGRSPFGLLDMSGSLAEWTSSLARPYPYEATDGREDPTLAGERVTRGGDYIFDSEPEQLTVTHRDGFSNAPGRGHRHIGFRCARS